MPVLPRALARHQRFSSRLSIRAVRTDLHAPCPSSLQPAPCPHHVPLASRSKKASSGLKVPLMTRATSWRFSLQGEWRGTVHNLGGPWEGRGEQGSLGPLAEEDREAGWWAEEAPVGRRGGHGYREQGGRQRPRHREQMEACDALGLAPCCPPLSVRPDWAMQQDAVATSAVPVALPRSLEPTCVVRTGC